MLDLENMALLELRFVLRSKEIPKIKNQINRR